MKNYQELYFHMMQETEKALRLLIKAQQECEEAYLSFADKEACIQMLSQDEKSSEEHNSQCFFAAFLAFSPLAVYDIEKAFVEGGL